MIRYLTAGESHGEALIGIVEGMPAGVSISPSDLNVHLRRRWLGYGRGGRSKFEGDQVHIFSGIRFGKTMGSPISLKLDNAAYQKDKSNWPAAMSIDGNRGEVGYVTLPRPGHADLVGVQKYRFDDIRPVIERSSARETAMRVACCSVARALLTELGISVVSHVIRIGSVGYDNRAEWGKRVNDLSDASGIRAVNDAADESEVRMLSPELTEKAIEHIKQTKKDGDSLGGVYEVIATGVPEGLGSYVHWDRRLDGRLAQAIMSIQAQKAFEIGDGVTGAQTPGSLLHDPIVSEDGIYRRSSNRAGGIEGGVTTGMPIVVRGYMKPIPTLIKPLATVDIASGEAQPTRYERSDVTSVPAASTVAESTVAFELANAILEKFGGDSLAELSERFPSAN